MDLTPEELRKQFEADAMAIKAQLAATKEVRFMQIATISNDYIIGLDCEGRLWRSSAHLGDTWRPLSMAKRKAHIHDTP